MSSYKILRVNDKTDSYYTKKKDIFDLPFRLLIIGKSFLSGKSTVILNLLLRERFFKNDFKGENIFIISNNAMDNKMRILKAEKDVDAHNFMQFSEANLEAVYEEVEERALEAISEGKRPPNSLIVIDDVAFSGGLKESERKGTLSRIFCNGRHINLSVIVTAQKHSQLSTTKGRNQFLVVNFTEDAIYQNSEFKPL